MTSVQLRISIPQFLHKMAEIDRASNKSARVQELMTKGLMAERQENEKTPPPREWTGDIYEGFGNLSAFIA